MNNLQRQFSAKHFFYVFLIAAFLLAYYPVIRQLVEAWYRSEDHSHGFMIVPVSLYIVWQKRQKIAALACSPGRGGSFLVAISILIYIFAYLSRISTLSSFALILTIWAIVWSLFGSALFKTVLFPLLLLILMIPVPAQFYSLATIPLQLFVSKVSAIFAGWLGIPILREGNVLHLPGHTLAVVQACSGLRSLMALMTLCAIFGYMTLNSNIFRAIMIVASVPAAILVNAMRVITMILVFYYFNFDLSRGSIHTVFGVGVFILALLIVVLIRSVLSKWDIAKTLE
jgi:exosortase A